MSFNPDSQIRRVSSSTNTHVPAPFWNTVVPTRIPLSSCNDAADMLITLLRRTSTPSGSNFSEEEADAEFKRVVGGEKWWQVRGLDGLEAEWIAMNGDWEQISKAEKRKEKKKQRHREHAAKRNARHGKHPMEDSLTNEEYTEDIDNLTRVMVSPYVSLDLRSPNMMRSCIFMEVLIFGAQSVRHLWPILRVANLFQDTHRYQIARFGAFLTVITLLLCLNICYSTEIQWSRVRRELPQSTTIPLAMPTARLPCCMYVS